MGRGSRRRICGAWKRNEARGNWYVDFPTKPTADSKWGQKYCEQTDFNLHILRWRCLSSVDYVKPWQAERNRVIDDPERQSWADFGTAEDGKCTSFEITTLGGLSAPPIAVGA